MTWLLPFNRGGSYQRHWKKAIQKPKCSFWKVVKMLKNVLKIAKFCGFGKKWFITTFKTTSKVFFCENHNKINKNRPIEIKVDNYKSAALCNFKNFPIFWILVKSLPEN